METTATETHLPMSDGSGTGWIMVLKKRWLIISIIAVVSVLLLSYYFQILSITILVAHWAIIIGLSLRVIARRLPVGVSPGLACHNLFGSFCWGRHLFDFRRQKAGSPPDSQTSGCQTSVRISPGNDAGTAWLPSVPGQVRLEYPCTGRP